MKTLVIILTLAGGEVRQSNPVPADACPAIAAAVVAQAPSFITAAECRAREA